MDSEIVIMITHELSCPELAEQIQRELKLHPIQFIKAQTLITYYPSNNKEEANRIGNNGCKG